MEDSIHSYFLCPCGLCRVSEETPVQQSAAVRLIPRIVRKGPECAAIARTAYRRPATARSADQGPGVSGDLLSGLAF
jgi:hypothetical protein